MTLLIAIIIGLAVGALVGYLLLDSLDTLVICSIMGLVGALIASAVYTLVGVGPSADRVATVAGTLVATIGALLSVLLFAWLHKIAPQRLPQPHKREIQQSEVDDIESRSS